MGTDFLRARHNGLRAIVSILLIAGLTLVSEITAHAYAEHTIVVTSLIDDTGTVTAGDGTLRGAILEANAGIPDDYYVIELPSGTFNISVAMPDIQNNIRIHGVSEHTVLAIDNLIDTHLFMNQKYKLTLQDLSILETAISPNLLPGSVAINSNGTMEISSVTFHNIANQDGVYVGLISQYGRGVTNILDSNFSNISSSIIASDYGTTPGTSETDTDYTNRIYVNNSTFENVGNIANMARFLKIENSTFRSNQEMTIFSGNNRFQLLNSNIDGALYLGLGLAWDTASYIGGLTNNERVISGNTFHEIPTVTPFISSGASSRDGLLSYGLVTITNNNFGFLSGIPDETHTVENILQGVTTMVADSYVFSGNSFHFPFAPATTAVITSESSLLQHDLDAAQALVTALPDSSSKTALQARIDSVQAAINAAKSKGNPDQDAVAAAKAARAAADAAAAKAARAAADELKQFSSQISALSTNAENSKLAPTIETYLEFGVKGVTSSNLIFVNELMKQLAPSKIAISSVDQIVKVATIVAKFAGISPMESVAVKKLDLLVLGITTISHRDFSAFTAFVATLPHSKRDTSAKLQSAADTFNAKQAAALIERKKIQAQEHDALLAKIVAAFKNL